jgi:xylulokinase
LTRWFRDLAARELDDDAALGELAKEAEASPPGANGLVVLPYFSGERTPIHDANAKGMIFGLNLTHNRADLYRGLLEGIAFGTNHIIETYREIGHMPRQLRAVGGGTRSRVWLQATSDVSGLAQAVCKKTMGACYGDAFLAALGVGEVRKGDILAWNPEERRILPRSRHRAAYDRQYRIFKELYGRNRDLMAELT